MLIVREAIRRRYALLPYWYTLFREADQSGIPPMRPLWVEFPKDSQGFAVQVCMMKNVRFWAEIGEES